MKDSSILQNPGEMLPEDTPLYRSAEDIYAEHLRRLRQRSRIFNPLSGEYSPGERRQLEIPDFPLPIQYLPLTMEREPLIVLLRREGSLMRASQILGLDPSAIARQLILLRMRHDFPFWAALTVKIKRKGGGADTNFILNPPQCRLVEAFERERNAGRPIRIILLKARQWGGSTCVQLYMAWLQLIHVKGLNSLIIAHQGVGSDEIKDMYDRMILHYPSRLLDYPCPKRRKRKGKGLSKQRKTEGVGKSGLIFRVPARNCKVKIGTAERPDSCRGGDYNLVHLSEVGIWRATDGKTPEDIVRSACGGVLLRPMTMIVYESTANGTGNFFHREYLAACSGESQFRPLFVRWFEIPQYSSSLSPEEARAFARRLWEDRNSDTSTSRTESGRYLYRLFESGADLEAISWYVAERSKYSDHSRMAAEYPSDDIEAFAHSGSRVFDRYDVERLRKECRDPMATGEVVSSSPDGPDSLDDIRFQPSAGGGMQVWAFPAADSGMTDRYLTVVDVGGRSDKADWSVITVIDRAAMAEGGNPEIVAQWRGHCDADILAWRSARIARFYQDSLLVIESNTLETRDATRLVDGGQLPYILLQIREAYPNLYMRGGSAEDLSEGKVRKLGFHTNSVTKPMVIATLVRVVREGLYVERSADALDELISYERRSNGSYGAIPGRHDDILMTRAIGLHIALHEMELPRRLPSSSRHPSLRRRQRPLTEASF